MYLLISLDKIIGLAVAFVVVSALVTIASMIYISETDDKKPMWLPYTSFAMAVFWMVVAALTPTTKQMAAIILVPKIANSEKVQMAGNKLYDLAVEWMDELKPTRAKEGGAK